MGKWYIQKLDVKTRVCVDCCKRKDIKEFHIKKPPYKHKFKQYTPNRRRDCKTCHAKKCRKKLLQTTTKEERRIYITSYMRQRNNTLPTNYRAIV